MSNSLQFAVGTTDTTLTVEGTIQSPVNGGILTVESEQILYGSCSDTQYFNCTRGYNSTTAATHAIGIAVTLTTPLPLLKQIHNVADPTSAQDAATKNYVDTHVGTGVSSLNTKTGAVTLSAGSNITLTPSGNNIAISASGGGSSPNIKMVQAATPGTDQVDYTVTPGWDPGNPEGTPLSLTITPSSSSAAIRVSLVCEFAFAAAATKSFVTIFMDSINLYGSSSTPSASYGQEIGTTNVGVLRIVLERYVVPGDTSPHTFTVQGAYLTGSDGFSLGTGDLTYIVEEVH